jgi:hypothetical protein
LGSYVGVCFTSGAEPEPVTYKINKSPKKYAGTDSVTVDSYKYFSSNY